MCWQDVAGGPGKTKEIQSKSLVFFQKIVQNGTIGPNFEQSTRSFTDENPPHGFNVLAEGLGFGMDLCEKVSGKLSGLSWPNHTKQKPSANTLKPYGSSDMWRRLTVEVATERS